MVGSPAMPKRFHVLCNFCKSNACLVSVLSLQCMCHFIGKNTILLIIYILYSGFFCKVLIFVKFARY